ncbi:aminodeoxychorismate synthase, component I [Candidatus Peregrinibacteria bacterium CG_4_10_14_0_2_um_filter_38_24]|nr:MAG: aminodeoxychorismate synthase, component I [Candidatus Peregrinibacteria bacterium CG_4_10_14_0_2_um_filter_38_24]PJC39282.1 MAG: aminodeoxychorismate synthase, component I [Candidatus Peregrinibacteria bacterium CG_4_9_14_0_2_um_filter_38_9]
MRTKIIKNKKLLDVFKRLKEDKKNVCLFHSRQKEGWEKILAWNPKEKFSYKTSKEDFEENVIKFIEKETRKKRKVLGFFSYDIGYKIHKIKNVAKDDLALPDIYLLSFENWITEEKNGIKTHFQEENFREEIEKILKEKSVTKITLSKNKNFEAQQSRNSYDKAYFTTKNHIKEGDIYQLNLTHRLHVKTKTPSTEIFKKIIENNEVGFLAYIRGKNFEILSASPERFIKIKGNKIETSPIKGTRPRGKTKAEDIKLKNELKKNKKEEAELNMITDLLRNDLGKFCKTGSVKVEEKKIIKKYNNVWHTLSKISGEIDKKTNPIKGLISMLPGGSITGCPKKRAIEIINEIEPTTRGIYTGIIGQITNKNDMDFSVAIRTIIRKKEDLYLQVGGGIVADSKNKDEFEETLHKAKSFMKIL